MHGSAMASRLLLLLGGCSAGAVLTAVPASKAWWLP